MNDFFQWLKGKKSYLLAAAAVAYAVAGFYLGQHDQETMITMILAALGISTVRHGVKTEADRQIKETEKKVEQTVHEAARSKLDSEGRSY